MLSSNSSGVIDVSPAVVRQTTRLVRAQSNFVQTSHFDPMETSSLEVALHHRSSASLHGGISMR
jgi:hypothetical protein